MIIWNNENNIKIIMNKIMWNKMIMINDNIEISEIMKKIK